MGEVPRYARVSRPFVTRVVIGLFSVLSFVGFMLLVQYFADDEPLTRGDWLLRTIGFLALGGLIYVFSTAINRNDPPTSIR